MKNSTPIPFIQFIKGIIISILMLPTVACLSQNVGISTTGTTPPNTSAGLDINFISQGFLIPRVALTSTASFAPLTAHVAGMIIYNTATAADVTPGFYYDNGAKWIATQPKPNATGDMQYWNGSTWINIPLGLPGQKLVINASGVPSWGP